MAGASASWTPPSASPRCASASWWTPRSPEPSWHSSWTKLGKPQPPKAAVRGNGPKTASKAMRFWSERSGAALDFIQPGKPTQDAFVESSNGKFRDSCLKAPLSGTSPTPSAPWCVVDGLASPLQPKSGHTARSAARRQPSGRSKPPDMAIHSLGRWTCFRGKVTRMAVMPECGIAVCHSSKISCFNAS